MKKFISGQKLEFVNTSRNVSHSVVNYFLQQDKEEERMIITNMQNMGGNREKYREYLLVK